MHVSSLFEPLILFVWKIFMKTEWPTNDSRISFDFSCICFRLVESPQSHWYCCVFNDSIYNQRNWYWFDRIRGWYRSNGYGCRLKSLRILTYTEKHNILRRYRWKDMFGEAANEHNTCVTTNFAFDIFQNWFTQRILLSKHYKYSYSSLHKNLHQNRFLFKKLLEKL